jgi:glutaminyl-peptide cyclotransferase
MAMRKWIIKAGAFVVLISLCACASVPPPAAPSATPFPTASLATTATMVNPPTPTTLPSPTPKPPPEFNGQRAYQDVETQVAFGPRTPGSLAHTQQIEWMKNELSASGWAVEVQETTYQNQPVRNVIAKRGTGQPWIILGAHFDSRMQASHDPDPANRQKPVPGADDGASGVAVLIELSRVLPKDLDKQVWLVFFDSEDQGQIPGWDWILGSRAFAESLVGIPDAVIVVDMIGDANLDIPKEQNSNQALLNEVWDAAAERGHNQFLTQKGYSMLDDHTPFLEKGIPALDIIDFNYPYWHTIEDTPDKVSADSLYAVGDTLLSWLTKKK